MKPALQSAYRHGLRWSLISALGVSLLQFLQMAVFARLAGPESAGDYALAATFISFLMPVAEAGLSQAVVQAGQIRPAHLAALAWVNWALGAFILLLLWLSGPFLAQWFGRTDLPGLLLLMGASLLITPLGAQASGLITREMQFKQMAKIEISAWMISIIATIGLAWNGWGAWSIALGFTLRNALASLGSFVVGYRIMPVHLFKISSLREITPLLRFGAFELSSRWADFFSNYLDKIIIAKWLGAAALGYYNLAFTFLMLPTARLATVITRVSFPLFAQIRHDIPQLQVFFERAAREILLLLFPIYFVLLLFSREIIVILFGNAWLPAAPLLIAFGLAGLVRSLCAPFPQLVKGLGKPQFWLLWMLIFSTILGLSLVLGLWYAPSIETAAWSRTLAKYTAEILLLGWLAAWCGVEFRPILRFSGKLLLAWLPVVVLSGLCGLLPLPFWPVTFLKSIVFIAGGWFVCARGSLRVEMRGLMGAFWK